MQTSSVARFGPDDEVTMEVEGDECFLQISAGLDGVVIAGTAEQLVRVACAILDHAPLVALLDALDEEASRSVETCEWCGGPHRGACPRWHDAPPPTPNKRRRPADYFTEDDS